MEPAVRDEIRRRIADLHYHPEDGALIGSLLDCLEECEGRLANERKAVALLERQLRAESDKYERALVQADQYKQERDLWAAQHQQAAEHIARAVVAAIKAERQATGQGG